MARTAKPKPTTDTNGHHPLDDFEGMTVASAVVKVTKAGDGLSEAMRLDPEAIPHGEEIYLVLKGVVAKVGYEPIPGADTLLRRVHTVVAKEVARVPAQAVIDLLAAEAERVLLLKEKEAGVQRLAGDPLGVFGPKAAESDEEFEASGPQGVVTDA